MKPFHTNHCGVSFITGAAVHVMHYIEPAVIVAKRLLEDEFSLIHSEVFPYKCSNSTHTMSPPYEDLHQDILPQTTYHFVSCTKYATVAFLWVASGFVLGVADLSPMQIAR